MIHNYHNDSDDNQADLFLIVGGLTVMALGSVILLKYHGIRENNDYNMEISNNIIKIIGNVVEVLGR